MATRTLAFQVQARDLEHPRPKRNRRAESGG